MIQTGFREGSEIYRTLKLTPAEFEGVKSILLTDAIFELPNRIERVPRHIVEKRPGGVEVHRGYGPDTPEQCLYVRRGELSKRVCVFPARDRGAERPSHARPEAASVIDVACAAYGRRIVPE